MASGIRACVVAVDRATAWQRLAVWQIIIVIIIVIMSRCGQHCTQLHAPPTPPTVPYFSIDRFAPASTREQKQPTNIVVPSEASLQRDDAIGRGRRRQPHMWTILGFVRRRHRRRRRQPTKSLCAAVCLSRTTKPKRGNKLTKKKHRFCS